SATGGGYRGQNPSGQGRSATGGGYRGQNPSGQGGSATGGGYRGQNPSGQGGAGKRSTGTNRTDKSAEPITTILEKPSVNYRPAKKGYRI
ncbi:MAG: hypothetical protein RR387_05515, partial [Clostridiales bacterium]